MAKLAAYAQYQASQQNQAKSKAGKSTNSGSGKIIPIAVVFSNCTLPYVSVTVTPAEIFDWGQYICSNNTAGAPVSCFKHVSEPRLT